MLARIYQPARSAMQSGQARSNGWILEFAPEDVKVIDPLMGWTGSGDMEGQVRLSFSTAEEAVAFATRGGIAYQLSEPKKRRHILRTNGYGDNFASHRRAAWTH